MFNSEKTIEAIGYLLAKDGGSMNYTKMLKILYIIDRESMRNRGFPLTYDTYVSMTHGPVLSKTYDEIKSTTVDGSDISCGWNSNLHRSNTSKYDVSWVGDAPSIGLLSASDLSIADKVWEEFGGFNHWQLIDIVHEFEEWEDPGETSVPISYERILVNVGYDEEEAEEISTEISEASSMEAILGLV